MFKVLDGQNLSLRGRLVRGGEILSDDELADIDVNGLVKAGVIWQIAGEAVKSEVAGAIAIAANADPEAPAEAKAPVKTPAANKPNKPKKAVRNGRRK